MKIICSKADLSTGVNIALKAVPVRTTMPILECIILKAGLNDIHLISNDMEIGIDTEVQGMILESGTVALDAKVFSEIIRKLPDNDVTITADENYRVSIACEKAHFQLLGRSAEEFPGLPQVEKDRQIVLSQMTLKDLIRSRLIVSRTFPSSLTSNVLAPKSLARKTIYRQIGFSSVTFIL